jgi:hypothetical protein
MVFPPLLDAKRCTAKLAIQSKQATLESEQDLELGYRTLLKPDGA